MLNIDTLLEVKNYIKAFESLRLKAYLCPASVVTIGYGTTVYPNGKKVNITDKITKEQAEQYFEYDVDKFEDCVRTETKVPLNNNQFSALVSLAYNIGCGNFHKSSLLKVLNEAKYNSAAQCFPKYSRAWSAKKNKYIALPGLLKRRLKEQEIFSRDISNENEMFTFFDKLNAKKMSLFYTNKRISTNAFFMPELNYEINKLTI